MRRIKYKQTDKEVTVLKRTDEYRDLFLGVNLEEVEVRAKRKSLVKTVL